MKSLKIISFALLTSLFFLMGFYMTCSEAQPPFIPPGSQLPQSPVKGACRKDPSITFTEEQTRILENLGRDFWKETKLLRDEMMDLRIEMRFAVSDPQAQSQVLLDKQRRMSAIQAKLENLRLSYLIRARSILTKEQLERIPPDCPLKMKTGYGVGRGLEKGPRKGWR
jgi:hypothetical protein